MIQKYFNAERFFKDQTVPISIRRMDPQPDSKYRHEHDFAELVLVTRGRALHCLGEQEYKVRAGDVYLIRPGTYHHFHETNDLAIINILFDAEKLAFPRVDLYDVAGYQAFFELEPRLRVQSGFRHKLMLFPEELAHVTAFVDTIEGELTDKQPGYGFQVQSVFMQLVCFLSRCYSQERSIHTSSLVRLSRLLTHLDQNYPQEITLDDMAQIACMSKSSLLREFRQATSRTPVEYLIRLRIMKGRDRLLASDDSITDIALAVGFNDGNYFSRKFKEITGITPRAFRNS